ncbi:MAG TPA: hypothetical protein VF145_13790 [Chitinophagaceae bacterium]
MWLILLLAIIGSVTALTGSYFFVRTLAQRKRLWLFYLILIIAGVLLIGIAIGFYATAIRHFEPV